MKRPIQGNYKLRDRVLSNSGILRSIYIPFSIAITIVFNTFFANAATISGEVYDVRSGSPLPGVELTCYDSLAVSGEDGSFELRDIPIGSLLFRAAYEGYAVYEDNGLIVPDVEELWVNIPMFPLDRYTPDTDEDFLGFFRRVATVIDKATNEWYDLPMNIGYDGGGLSYEEFEEALRVLNAELGGGFLTAGPIIIAGYPGDAVITITSAGEGPNGLHYDAVDVTGSVREQMAQIRAALLIAFLNGRFESSEIDDEKWFEEVTGEIDDYTAAVRVVYGLGPDFDFNVFRHDIRDRNGLLFSFAGGPGHYTRTGWSGPGGETYYLPVKTGMAGLAAGIGLRVYNFVGSAELFMITALASLQGETQDGLEIKDYSHNYRAYGGGVGYEIPIEYGSLSVRPEAGWQRIRIEGKYEAIDPENNAVVREIEKTETFSGPYGGIKVSLFTPWAKMGGYVEYRYIHTDGYVNYIDVGLGQAQWRGFGVYLNWRQYWNDNLSYALVGIGMNGEIGILN